jgi:hypothetical protein
LIAALAATLLACGCSAGQPASETAAATQGAGEVKSDELSALLEELEFSGTLLVSKGGRPPAARSGERFPDGRC